MESKAESVNQKFISKNLMLFVVKHCWCLHHYNWQKPDQYTGKVLLIMVEPSQVLADKEKREKLLQSLIVKSATCVEQGIYQDFPQNYVEDFGISFTTTEISIMRNDMKCQALPNSIYGYLEKGIFSSGSVLLLVNPEKMLDEDCSLLHQWSDCQTVELLVVIHYNNEADITCWVKVEEINPAKLQIKEHRNLQFSRLDSNLKLSTNETLQDVRSTVDKTDPIDAIGMCTMDPLLRSYSRMVHKADQVFVCNNSIQFDHSVPHDQCMLEFILYWVTDMCFTMSCKDIHTNYLELDSHSGTGNDLKLILVHFSITERMIVIVLCSELSRIMHSSSHLNVTKKIICPIVVAPNLKCKFQLLMMIANEYTPLSWNKLTSSQIIALLIHHGGEIELTVHIGWEYEPNKPEKGTETISFPKLLSRIQGNVWRRYADMTGIVIMDPSSLFIQRKLMLSTLDDAHIDLPFYDKKFYVDHWYPILGSKVVLQDSFPTMKLSDITSVMPYHRSIDECGPLVPPGLTKMNLADLMSLIEKLNSHQIADVSNTANLTIESYNWRELPAQKTAIKPILLVYPCSVTMSFNEKIKVCSIKLLEHHIDSYELLDVKNLCTIFNELASEPQTIMIEGKAGAGKTTLVKHFLNNNNEQFIKFTAVVYIQVGYRNFPEMKTLKDLAQALEYEEEALNDIHDAGSHALFIFDGFDNLNKHKHFQESIFMNILQKRVYPKSSIMILSRPSGLTHVRYSIKIDRHFQIIGLDMRDPNTKLNPLIRFREEYWITALCEQHPAILDMCETPLLAELTCQFFEQGHSDATLTDLLVYVVKGILTREAERKDDNLKIGSNLQLFDLPNEYCDPFESICKLALEVNMGIIKSAEDINRFLSAFMLNNMFNLNDCECFSLVEGTVDSIHDSEVSKIEFLHPIIQEFLAALHLSMQPPLDQLVLLYQYVSSTFKHCISDTNSYILPFFFGIVWRKEYELDSNPTKLMFNTLIEFLASCLEVETAKKSTHDLTLTLCVAETRDNELWKKFVTKLGADLCLTLSSDDIRKHKWTLANMVGLSEVREWTIYASNFDICSELEVYIGARINKVEISSMESKFIKLTPKVSIEAASKRQKDIKKIVECPDQIFALMNHFQCQAIREILQKAFTMFAERVRLRGDSSNPAYVSFLCCKCFEQKIEGNLKFDPHIPYHFLEVNSKKTLKKIEEEHGAHLTAAHDGKAMELVILLKPFLRRIILNYKSKEHCIVLMSEELSQKSIEKGAVECMVKKAIQNENLVTCNMDGSASSVKSEMVRPCLPLPSKIEQSFRSTVVLSQVIMAETCHIPTAPPTCIMHNEYGDDSMYQKAQEVHKIPRHHIPASQHQQQTCTTNPTQQTHHSRSSIKAGAILFTSVPR